MTTKPRRRPLERVEVIYDGKTISVSSFARSSQALCNLRAGDDQTKEAFPKVINNPAIARGMHILSMDNPVSKSNILEIRAVGDNYTAGAVVIDYLQGREEVDSDRC